MEKRINLELRGRKPEEITELNLDNCRSTQIEGLTEEFTNLESLSLINVGLTTLKGFPALPSLQRLELSDNRISSGLNLLKDCPNITHLNLSGNKIKDLDSIKPLAELPSLRNLDLFNCDVTQMDEYRQRVFELLTNIKYLDGFDKDEKEAEDEDSDDDEDVEEDDEEEDEEGVGASDSDDDGEDDDDEGLVEIEDDDDDDDDDDLDEEDVEDDEEEDEDDDDEDDEDEPGLMHLQKSNLEEDSEGEDFQPAEEVEEEDDLDEEDEEDEDAARGVKRKHEDEEEGDD